MTKLYLCMSFSYFVYILFVINILFYRYLHDKLYANEIFVGFRASHSKPSTTEKIEIKQIKARTQTNIWNLVFFFVFSAFFCLYDAMMGFKAAENQYEKTWKRKQAILLNQIPKYSLFWVKVTQHALDTLIGIIGNHLQICANRQIFDRKLKKNSYFQQYVLRCSWINSPEFNFHWFSISL